MLIRENTRKLVFILHAIKKYNRKNKTIEKDTFNNVILLLMLFVCLFVSGATAPRGAGSPHSRGF